MTTNNLCTEKQPSKCKRFKCIITSITLVALILSSACLFYKQQKLKQHIKLQQQQIEQLSLQIHSINMSNDVSDDFDSFFDRHWTNLKLSSFNFNLNGKRKRAIYNNENRNVDSYYSHFKSAAKDNEYIVTLSLLGIDKNDLKIEALNNKLIIQTIDQSKEQAQTKTSKARIKKSISIPRDVDQKQITTELKNGLLTITMPRIKEDASSQAQVITIQ